MNFSHCQAAISVQFSLKSYVHQVKKKTCINPTTSYRIYKNNGAEPMPSLSFSSSGLIDPVLARFFVPLNFVRSYGKNALPTWTLEICILLTWNLVQRFMQIKTFKKYLKGSVHVPRFYDNNQFNSCSFNKKLFLGNIWR